MSLIEAERATGAIEAQMSYAVRTGEKPVNETYGPSGLMRRSTGQYEQHAVTTSPAIQAKSKICSSSTPM